MAEVRGLSVRNPNLNQNKELTKTCTNIQQDNEPLKASINTKRQIKAPTETSSNVKQSREPLKTSTNLKQTKQPLKISTNVIHSKDKINVNLPASKKVPNQKSKIETKSTVKVDENAYVKEAYNPLDDFYPLDEELYQKVLALELADDGLPKFESDEPFDF